MMTPRLTVAAFGEDAASGVADCAVEFEPSFSSDRESGAGFSFSDLRHMGHLHAANSEAAELDAPDNREENRKVVHGECGVKRESGRNVEGERKKQVPLVRTPSECGVRGVIGRLRWYDFAP
jgi:hypothetical protein